jgi:hypothetical protein
MRMKTYQSWLKLGLTWRNDRAVRPAGRSAFAERYGGPAEAISEFTGGGGEELTFQ